MIFNKNNIDITEDLFELDENGNIVEGEVSFKERIFLLSKAMGDRRLSARDLKIYMFLMNISTEGFTQEEIADFLDITRVNVNRSISKLCLFNYIDKEQANKYVSIKYTVLDKNAGILNSSLDVLNIDKHGVKEKLTEEDIKELREELVSLEENICNTAKKCGLRIREDEVRLLLSDEKAKFLLLLTMTKNEKAFHFQHRYLEDTIRFNLQYDVFENKRLFMKVYYMVSNPKSYTLDDLMILAGRANRETSASRYCFLNLMASSLDSYNWVVDKLLFFNSNANEFDYVDIEFDNRFYKIRNLSIEQNRFTEVEFLFLANILNFHEKFKTMSYGVELNEYIKIKADWLNDEFNKVEELKLFFSGELAEAEEEREKELEKVEKNR